MAITTRFEIRTDSIDKNLKDAENKVQASANKMQKSFKDSDKETKFGQGIKEGLEDIGQGFDAVQKFGGKTGGVLKTVSQGLVGLLNPFGLVTAAITGLIAVGIKLWDTLTVNPEQAKATLDFLAKIRGQDTGESKQNRTEAQSKVDRLRELVSDKKISSGQRQQVDMLLDELGFGITSRQWRKRLQTEDFDDLQGELLAESNRKVKQARKEEIMSIFKSLKAEAEAGEHQEYTIGAYATLETAEDTLRGLIAVRDVQHIAADEEASKSIEKQIQYMQRIVALLKQEKKQEQALARETARRKTEKARARTDRFNAAVQSYNATTDQSDEEKRAREQREQTEQRIKFDGMTDRQKIAYYNQQIKKQQAKQKQNELQLGGAQSSLDRLDKKYESTQDLDQRTALLQQMTKINQRISRLNVQQENSSTRILQLQQARRKVEVKISDEKQKQREEQEKQRKQEQQARKRAEEERKKAEQKTRRDAEQIRQKRINDLKQMFNLQKSPLESLQKKFPDLTDKQLKIVEKSLGLKKTTQLFSKTQDKGIVTNELTQRGGFKTGAFVDTTRQRQIALNTKLMKDTTKQIYDLLKKGGLI